MYDLHHLGWSSFQELCLTITREVLSQTVESFLDSNDAGRDGAFIGSWQPNENEDVLNGRFVIQCKHSSRPNQHFTKSVITNEIPKIQRLVQKGICDVYILMTNLGVSARNEEEIQNDLKAIGVKHVCIFGSTWIESQIKTNSRLRMLVPRVYGLGDLSQILDDRAYRQAKAVLESMKEELAKVVITDSYKRAVNALDQHGFILLIGEPAAGKTTIASMLAIASADMWKASVIKLTNLAQIIDHWNVDEPAQFFWIDDAFGVTQYESSLSREWNHSLPHVKAMLSRGVKIVMTSRDYIYNLARQDLKMSAFPLLNESQVVIDVHDLKLSERQQILYNHLKRGRQPFSFLSSIKPYLEQIAEHQRFIPEIARRLSDPIFTNNLSLNKCSLMNFVERREELLCEIIDSLDIDSKAALSLIYMRKGILESPFILNTTEENAIERLGSTLGECIKALEALNNSLVIHHIIEDQPTWLFKHPTIGDAYANILSSRSDLLGIFLTGCSIDSLISQITCGDLHIEKAILVPKSLFSIVITRLLELTNGSYKLELSEVQNIKSKLYWFLSRRCSKEFLEQFLEYYPEVFQDISSPGLYLSVVPEVDLAICLYNFSILPEIIRKQFVKHVSDYTISGEDTYVFQNKDLSNIFTQNEYEDLVEQVRSHLIPRLKDVRLEVESNYTSGSPDDHMQELLESFKSLKQLFYKDSKIIKYIEQEIDLTNEWIVSTEIEDTIIEQRVLGKIESLKPQSSNRSIFDDIDEGFD